MSAQGVLPSVSAEREGPTLVLLHGGPGLNDYMGLLEAETTGWRRVRYQQRGHTPSVLTGPFTVEQHLQDLIAVLDDRVRERCVLLGHSWGCHLALQASLAVPERLDGIVLIDAPGSVDDGGLRAMAETIAARMTPEQTARIAELGESIAGGDDSPAVAAELVALQWPSYFADPSSAPPAPPGLAFNLTANAETMASLFDELQGDFADRLTTCELPVELVVGERSPIPSVVSRRTAELLPRGRITVIPGAGHLPWYEQPGCVREALARV